MKIRPSESYWDAFLQHFDRPADKGDMLSFMVMNFIIILCFFYLILVLGLICLLMSLVVLCCQLFSGKKLSFGT